MRIFNKPLAFNFVLNTKVEYSFENEGIFMIFHH